MNRLLAILLGLLGAAQCFAPVVVNPFISFPAASFNELTPTGGLWVYDASQESYANNDAVTQLTDRYGAGVNVVQATSSKQPVFKTGIQNSLPAVLFDGVDDLIATSAAYGNSLSAFTVFIVLQTSDIFAVPIANQIGFVFGRGWGIWIDSGASYGVVTKDNSGSGFAQTTTQPSNTSWQILMLTYDGTTITIKRNKNAATRTATLSGSIPATTSFLTLGSYATGGYYMSGYIGETCGYNWVFDSTTEDNMWTFLGTKWGITLTP